MKNFFSLILSLSMIVFITSMENNHTVLADDTSSVFDPEEFYSEILNEQRPENAESYRFLDLDGDGKEELLIGHENIFAVYSVDNQNNKPVNLFMTDPSAPRYNLFGNGIVCSNPNPNMHSIAPYGHIYYRISEGKLVPIIAYLHNERIYKTDNSELITSPMNFDFTQWEDITNDVKKDFYDYIRDDVEKTGLNIESFNPYMESFINYDADKDFKKTNQEKPLSVSGRYGYDELIQRYKDLFASPDLIPVLNVTQGIHCLNTDNYSFLLREYSYTKPCFVLRDLNGDGIYELAVGCQENDGSFKLFDLYTIHNNNIIHLAASGWRDLFSIGMNNEIIESGSGGAANSTVISYTIENGRLKPIRMVSVENGTAYDYDNYGTATENKHGITDEEYFEKSDTQFVPNQNQEVIMFKDWYTGMKLSNELGDVTGDGIIDGRDATDVLTDYAKTSTGQKSRYNEEQQKAADVNNDNIIDGRDATAILTYYAKISVGEKMTIDEFINKTTTTTSTTTTSKPTMTTTTTKAPTSTISPFTLDISEITLTSGEQYTIKANQSDLTYKSNNTNVAIVSKNGVITAFEEGFAIISVYNSEYDVVQIKVNVNEVATTTTTVTTTSSTTTTKTTTTSTTTTAKPTTASTTLPFTIDIEKEVFVEPGGKTEIHYGGSGIIISYTCEGEADGYFTIRGPGNSYGFCGTPYQYYAEKVTLTCASNTPPGDYKIDVQGAVCIIHVKGAVTSTTKSKPTTTTTTSTVVTGVSVG